MILLGPTADTIMLRRDRYCTRPWGYLALKDFPMTITVSGLQQKFSSTVKFQVISVQLIFQSLSLVVYNEIIHFVRSQNV